MRVDYEAMGLRVADLTGDPGTFFDRWFGEAEAAGVPEANAFALATATPDGRPSARVVLMKAHDGASITFFTNQRSRKGDEIAANPRVSGAFHWQPLHRQVRFEGTAAMVPPEMADEYFASRPEGARRSAIASPQSQVVPDRRWLLDRVDEVEGLERPEGWGGYRVEVDAWEFWQGQPSRLHDRVRAEREGDTWRIERLAP
ncbi:MAG: pyridoxamine 5'-phosphate oxidase [Acidimicrobiia bacterium]|nr:pyridoxamine 5'-phosphate oxidase [Acidimicrobiia bacterium]